MFLDNSYGWATNKKNRDTALQCNTQVWFNGIYWSIHQKMVYIGHILIIWTILYIKMLEGSIIVAS